MASTTSKLGLSTLPGLMLTPKADFLLVPRKITTQDGTTRILSDAELVQMVSYFKSLGRPLVVDYEHQTMGTIPGFEHFASPDGKAPAAGWIAGMEIKFDGIWAQGTLWTGKAAQMMTDGEYRYFSPVIFWDGKPFVGKAVALGPVALTNDPQINGLEAIAARADYAQLLSLVGKESDMDYKKLIAELMGLDGNAPDEQFATALKSKMADTMTASKKVPDLETQVTALKSELTTAKAAAGEVSVLKSTHGTETAALKATHEQSVTALKAAHDTQVTALKGDLAAAIADRLEETGRISTADKPAILETAKADPKIVLTAFKNIKVGAVVPVGTLGLGAGKAGTVALPKNEHDNISASKAFANATPEVQQQHIAACNYAKENGVSYAEAIRVLAAAAT